MKIQTLLIRLIFYLKIGEESMIQEEAKNKILIFSSLMNLNPEDDI